MEIALSPLHLDESGTLRRQMARAVEHRQPGYEREYDFFTVFYDCFRTSEGDQVVCLGPPLFNLAPHVRPVIEQAFANRTAPRVSVRRLDRIAEFRIKAGGTEAQLNSPLFRQDVLRVQPNHSEMFEGRRVLLAISKDNELAWIRDWVEFHVANHACDAVLLYDNGSTSYTVEDVADVITSVDGVDVAQAIDWAYKFGPTAGGTKIWDSNFAQHGMLQHARHRFLARASAVVNVDIDELVVTRTRESVFELVCRSRTGFVRFPGTWVESATTLDDGEHRRHGHYFYRKTVPRPAAAKWAVVPSRCPETAQWRVHTIDGMEPDQAASESLMHRHFAAITTNWNYRRWKLERPTKSHLVDEELVRCMHNAGWH